MEPLSIVIGLVSGHERLPVLALRVGATDQRGAIYAHVLLTGERMFAASVLRQVDIGYGLPLSIGELEFDIPAEERTSGEPYQPGALVLVEDRTYLCAEMGSQVSGTEFVFISLDDRKLNRIDITSPRTVFKRWRLLSHRMVQGTPVTDVLVTVGQW